MERLIGQQTEVISVLLGFTILGQMDLPASSLDFWEFTKASTHDVTSLLVEYGETFRRNFSEKNFLFCPLSGKKILSFFTILIVIRHALVIKELL